MPGCRKVATIVRTSKIVIGPKVVKLCEAHSGETDVKVMVAIDLAKNKAQYERDRQRMVKEGR